MYFSLFHSITDAIEILKAAQQTGEEMFINGDEKESDEKEEFSANDMEKKNHRRYKG